MARLGGNATHSVVVLSSSDEDEDAPKTLSSNKPGASTSTGTAQYRGIPADFMRVIKKLRENLREENDDRRCNIISLMYRKASSTLTQSEMFKNFVKDFMEELEKSKKDRASVLLLLTSLCQTLAVGEIMWSPVHKDGENSKNSKQKESEGRSSKTTTRNERPKETREQCNAVKALLFNVDGQTAQSSTRETSASGRTSRERATTTTTTTNSK